METTTLAREYADMARLNFECDGEVEPILAAHGPDLGIICGLAPSADVPVAIHKVAAVLAAVLGVETFVTVNETWSTTVTEEEVERILAGEDRDEVIGGRARETTLLTVAWRQDPEDCHAVHDTVLTESSRRFRRDEAHGRQPGRFGELMALAFTNERRPPVGTTLEQLLGFLGREGLIVFAQVLK